MDKLIKLIKRSMVNFGRDDFTKFLSEILNISPSAASAKLHGDSTITADDISLINAKLNFNPDELAEALK